MLNFSKFDIQWASVLIALGWFVVHWLSRRRDIDKFQRELIVKVVDGLLGQIQLIQELSFEYHAGNERNKDKEVKLNSSLQDIGMQHRLLPNLKIFDLTQFSVLHKNLRQSITARHFEDDFYGAEVDVKVLSEKIAACCLQLRTYFIEMKFDQIKF